MRRTLSLALLCLWLCVGMAQATEETIPEPYEPGPGYENLSSTDIYAAPEEGAAYAGHLATGELVTVLDNQGDWVQVEASRAGDTSLSGWLLRNGIGRVGFDMPYFGKAYVANPKSDDLLNLREGPGKEHSSLGLYYNGAEALCWSDPEEEDWVLVTIGQVAGYMQRQYLRMETEGATAAFTPLMVVNNPDAAQGLNLREEPDLSSEALGQYPNGQRVVVLGVSGEWAHVQMAGADDELTTETGYMLRNYLIKAETAAPALLEATTLAPADTLRPAGAAAPVLRADGQGAEGFRYFERGYTVVCAVSELYNGGNEGEQSKSKDEGASEGSTASPNPALTEGNSVGRYYAHTILAYDDGFAAVDGIVAFRLYLNDQMVATLEPYSEGEIDLGSPPTRFRCIFAFEGDLASAHLVPVLAAAGEHSAEAVSLMLR